MQPPLSVDTLIQKVPLLLRKIKTSFYSVLCPRDVSNGVTVGDVLGKALSQRRKHSRILGVQEESEETPTRNPRWPLNPGCRKPGAAWEPQR